MAARPVQALDVAASTFIRSQVAASRLPHTEVAARAGMSYASFRRYLHGQKTMTTGDFLTLLDVLGATPGHAVTEIRRIAAKG